MVAINTNVSPDLKSLSQDDSTDATDDAQGATVLASSVNSVQDTGAIKSSNALSASGFDGTVTSGGKNVLGTTPPALTAPLNASGYADAVARAQTLASKQPFRTALMRSSEDGTAPAVKNSTTSNGTSSGVQTNQLSVATSSSGLATTVGSSGSQATSDSTYSYDSSNHTNNTDTTAFSDAANQAATELRTTASNIKDKPCGKEDYVGDKATVKTLTGLGMNKGRAETIARFLDDQNNGGQAMHNDQDEQTTALAIGALQALKKAGNKDGASSMLEQLNNLADQIPKSTTTVAAGQAYYQTMNTMGQYALSASANAATASLTTPTASTTSKLVPYPVISD